MHAVMFVMFVKRLYPHRPHPFSNQITNRIIDHRASEAGLEPEAIREVCGHIEFTTAYMNVTARRFAEGDHAGVQPVNQCAK